ncbi:MAG: 50S ribosomal protein L16 [DPANN group archaeon]|nr:50S ribosomal protein L16 [DPANN group archaeon]
MAKLRDARAYRRTKRPFTRISKLRSKGYVKGAPQMKTVQYDMGNSKLPYSHEVQLICTKKQQIRDNALEAARQAAVRYLDLNAAKEGYYVKLRAVPHHIIRMKPLATGAGADRFQQGMSLSYGSPEGHAAQVKPGKILFSFYVNENQIEIAREAARKAGTKLPMHCKIEVLNIIKTT